MHSLKERENGLPNDMARLGIGMPVGNGVPAFQDPVGLPVPEKSGQHPVKRNLTAQALQVNCFFVGDSLQTPFQRGSKRGAGVVLSGCFIDGLVPANR